MLAIHLRTLATALLLSLAIAACGGGDSGSSGYSAGVDYRSIGDPDPSTSGPIPVQEFFAFECPHCATLEPVLQSWLASKGDSIAFSKVPMAGNPRWVPGARAYHAAMAAGVADAMVPRYFDAVHVRRRSLQNEDELAILFRLLDVPEERFRSLYRSDAVTRRMDEADALARRYQVRFTPTLVVDGRYLVEPRSGVSWERTLEVVDHLVEKARAERGR